MLRLALAAGAVLAVLASYGGTYYAGHRAGVSGEALRTERAVAVERERVQRASEAVLSAARKQTEQSEAENMANEERARNFEAELEEREAEIDKLIAEDAARPVPAPCRCSSNPKLSTGDAEKLNAIR